MATTVHLPGALVEYTDGNTEFVCDDGCGTVREALAAVAERYPALVDRILNERGEVREHVNVFVGEESIRYLGGLEADIPDGAAVSIVPAVSGG